MSNMIVMLAKIVKLARLGWTQEKIAKKVELTQQGVGEITKNTNFGEIGKMLSEGREMSEITDHYQIDLALAWALRLEGKEDRIRFRGVWVENPKDDFVCVFCKNPLHWWSVQAGRVKNQASTQT